jgi:putative glutamine amidotransferase
MGGAGRGAPAVGVCAALEHVSWAVWKEEEVVLAPRGYATAVQRAGGLALLLPPDPAASEGPDALLDRLDALMLAGGADVDPASYGAARHAETAGTWPERDRFEIALARRALEREMPVLGICRGMQILNVALGGDLDQHLPERIGHEGHRLVPGKFGRHRVRLAPESLAERACGAVETEVFSHHHQGVARLGEGLEASGWDVEDGLVEAIEAPELEFALGVIWHPEEDPDSEVVPALVRAAGGELPLPASARSRGRGAG